MKRVKIDFRMIAFAIVMVGVVLMWINYLMK